MRTRRANGHRLHPRLGGAVARTLGRVGIDARRCLCPRCVGTRCGLYRREQVRYGNAVYVETRILGFRVRRQLAYETAPEAAGGEIHARQR